MVTLHFDSEPTSVFCHMGNFGCGDGGWTPVMKINGYKVWLFLLKCQNCEFLYIYNCECACALFASSYLVLTILPRNLKNFRVRSIDFIPE